MLLPLLVHATAMRLLFCLQVAMRRALLLASVCVNAAQDTSDWTERYRKVIVGPRGENICVGEGHRLARERLAQAQSRQMPIVIEQNESATQLTLTIARSDCFKLVSTLNAVQDAVLARNTFQGC